MARNLKNIGRDLDKLDSEIIKALSFKTLRAPLPDIRVDADPRSLSRALNALKEKVNTKNYAQALRDKLDDALRAAMTQKIWQTLDGNDDIFDTGALLDSQKVSVQGSSILISYDQPYAGLVHYGGYIAPYGNESAKRIFLPARPWVDVVLNDEFAGFNVDVEISNILLDLIR